MTSGAHDAGGGFGRSAGANAARGIMVIVAAVIVGVLLMNRGLGQSSAETDASGTDNTDAAATGVTTTVSEVPADTASTTEPVEEQPLQPPRDPSEVAVLVINGTEDLKGVAGRGTDVLKPLNYITRDPKNADTNGASVILYIEGFESEAIEVAKAYGVDPVLLVQPFDPATSPIEDTQDANIVVRIGSDGVIQV